MRFIAGPFLYVVIVIVALALLLLILWLLSEFLKKRFFDNAVKQVLQPLPLTTWGEISAPDGNGIMTTVGVYTMEGVADQIQLSLKGKDRSVLEDFTKNVKFQFSPIYTAPPVDLIQTIMTSIGTQRNLDKSSSKGVSRLDNIAEAALPENIILDAFDSLLEFGMQLNPVSTYQSQKLNAKQSVNNQQYFGIAFNIDPTITRIHRVDGCPKPIKCSCNRRDYYSSTQKTITAIVSVTEGSVQSTPGTTVSAGHTGPRITISNSDGDRKYFSISGKQLNANTYQLSGTWFAS